MVPSHFGKSCPMSEELLPLTEQGEDRRVRGRERRDDRESARGCGQLRGVQSPLQVSPGCGIQSQVKVSLGRGVQSPALQPFPGETWQNLRTFRFQVPFKRRHFLRES
jgi:hypothetical protein